MYIFRNHFRNITRQLLWRNVSLVLYGQWCYQQVYIWSTLLYYPSLIKRLGYDSLNTTSVEGTIFNISSETLIRIFQIFWKSLIHVFLYHINSIQSTTLYSVARTLRYYNSLFGFFFRYFLDRNLFTLWR